MMNYVVLGTESSENANKRVHILILIFVKTVRIPCFKTLSIQRQAICTHCSFTYTILSQHIVAFEFTRVFLFVVLRESNNNHNHKETRGFITWFGSPQRLAYVHVVEVSHKGYGVSCNSLLFSNLSPRQ
jgi:hypothetical protein